MNPLNDSLEDYKNNLRDLKSSLAKIFDMKEDSWDLSDAYENLSSNLKSEMEEYQSSRNVGSYSTSYSLHDVFEGKAMINYQTNNRPSLLKLKKAHDFPIDITYKSNQLIGKRNKTSESGINAEILDLDFGAVEHEATDYEKEILNVLKTQLDTQKWNDNGNLYSLTF